LVFTLVDFRTLTYGNYTYPLEATILGFFIASTSVAMVPIVAIYKVTQLDGPIKEVLHRELPRAQPIRWINNSWD
jgi:hypothetical protein